jgi:thiol-disulfide isomerase/thioredoxin
MPNIKSHRRKTYKKRARITKKKQRKPVIVGLIHAHWCGHCQTLMPIWKKMLKGNKMFDIVEIESSETDKDTRMADINSKLSKDSPKLEANGFPTIFKVKNGILEYYNQARQADIMYKWFSS